MRVHRICLLLLLSASAGGAADPTPEEQLATARAQFKAAVAKLDKTLLDAFDTNATLVRESAKPAEVKQKVLDQLKREKADYEAHGWYPWSEAMRPALVAMIRDRMTAEKAVAAALDKVADSYTRSKHDTEAAAVLKAKKETLAPKLVARWELTGTNWDGTWVGKLYSNGHYSDPDGKAVWALEKGVVTLRQPEAGFPGGTKVLKWTLKESGTELDEVGNNNGARSVGKLANVADEK